MRYDAYSKESDILKVQTRVSSSTGTSPPKTARPPTTKYYVISDPRGKKPTECNSQWAAKN